MRRTGSSLLVVGEGDGGGGLWVAPVAERAVRVRWVVERLGGDGARTGGVLGGGGRPPAVRCGHLRSQSRGTWTYTRSTGPREALCGLIPGWHEAKHTHGYAY